MKYLKDKKSGFSIIEVLVAVFVVTLLGMAVGLYQKDVFSLNRFLTGGLDVQVEARRAFKNMTAEIRSMSTSNQGAYPISQAATSSFIFYSNVDNDALKEKVRYFLEGSILKKGVVKPTGSPLSYSGSEVVENIATGVVNSTSTPVFEYYDTDYDGTTGPLSGSFSINAVRLVKIILHLDRDQFNPPGSIVVTTQVSIRNLKDNL